MEARIILLFSCCVVFCTGNTELQQCGRNEELSCVQDCPGEVTCRTRGLQDRCMQSDQPCQTKCLCKSGHYRNSMGDCVTEQQCDQCNGPNEFYDCGRECDNECSNPTQNRTHCPIANIVCVPKCYCEDGFARNSTNDCVPIEKCPKTEICGPNEEYVSCKMTCPPEICFAIVAFYKCSVPVDCVPGCACKPGHYRETLHSTCIDSCECPQMKNDPDCKHRKIYTIK